MQNAILELAAENHYMIRPILVNALKNQVLMAEGRRMFPNASNYHDVWARRFSDRFFDMATMIRVATSIETVLRDFYMSKKGHSNLIELRADTEYKMGIFQRIMPWHGNGAIQLLSSLGVDITVIPEFPVMQEIMLHRHLYAHNAGLLDDKYIDDLKKLTSVDLMADSNISASYPAQDTFYFEPLKRLSDFIEAGRRFSRALI